MGSSFKDPKNRLRLSQNSFAQYGQGKLLNIMQVDTQRDLVLMRALLFEFNLCMCLFDIIRVLDLYSLSCRIHTSSFCYLTEVHVFHFFVNRVVDSFLDWLLQLCVFFFSA